MQSIWILHLSSSNYIFFVETLTNPTVTAISAVSSILGLLFSLFLTFLTWNIKEKIFWVDDIKEFNKHRQGLQNRLSGYKDSIYKDGLLDDKLLSDLMREVLRFGQFRRLLSIQDRVCVFFTLRNIKKGKYRLDKQKLNHQLTYIISRYDKDEGGIL
jgi:hypothetical protein